ncbi:hypothetical protein AX15_007080 [Amanita polypyramis BW_CC]|nr:hypothetical protein AX15_007080 [Amanita polypyramis BW_CC]
MFLLPLLLVANVVHAALPLVDFDRMGLVGISGLFDGFDFFSNASQTLDPSSSSIVSRSSDSGALAYVASTNSGGRVLTSCVLNDIIYLAGSFSAIEDVPLNNVASYDLSSHSFVSLSSSNSGPNGPINIIFCDEKGNKLWVGGSFTSPGRAVAVYDIKSKSWSSPPFSGFAGAQDRVFSITTNSSKTSLFFAGSFITAFQGSGSPLPNGQNNPNIPFSPGATPFSSSLVPIPLQSAQILGSPSSTDQGFTDIYNILCPAGGDGPGNTWFGQDGSPALITIRTFSYISASGLRLGNAFEAGHSTTEFSVTTIPDNSVQTLSYIDPVSGQTQTCSTACPLSTDPSIIYQDFLFQNALSITGIQVQISGFAGTSPGLHILQILSSGAFASAVDSNNSRSCYAPNPSNVTLVGAWQKQIANTDIAGTTQPVLVSTVDVGTASASAPSITWMPYVSAEGNYNINLLVPGCANLQDCGSRTSVKVTVFPGEGLQPSVTTVSQANEQDASLLIYSGPILPSSPSFVATITMTLADNPGGTGQGGKYDIVADRVQLVLNSVNGTTSASNNGTSGTPGMVKSGFGLFEWPLGGASEDATTALTNSSESPVDSIGVDLFNGIGAASGSIPTSVSIKAVAHHASGAIYLGGEFALSSGSASGSANIVLYKSGTLAGLPDRGLNGPVSSIAVSGNLIFVGGAFSDTASGSFQGSLRGVAIYDSQQNKWQPLGAGVDGDVTGLTLTDSRRLLVAGKFTKAYTSHGDIGVAAGGLAVWDTENATWVNSGGFLISQLDMVNNVTSTTQLLVGNVSALQKYGTSGVVMLKNGGKTGPSITPLGIQFELGTTAAPASISTLNNTRRNWHLSSSWSDHGRFHRLSTRQNPSSGQLFPLPQLPPATAPTVLAGTFWTNNSKELVVIGGNFSYATTGLPVSSIGIYDPQSTAIQGLAGAQINGTVRALLVDNNKLYVGGEFALPGSNANGLAVYDLSSNEWTAVGLQPLQGDSPHPVIVRAITKSRSKGDTVIVAGSFASAGALDCAAICSFGSTTLQWNRLGSGIAGEVASVAYAGANQELLIVAGSIKLSDGTITNVAQYSLNNETWTSIGSGSDLPGPVTAVEVNDGNVRSIFAAGRSNDSSTSFLSFWNGQKWTSLESSFESNTTITQLRMVPLQNTHASNDVIEPDRALMVSGMLTDSEFGNVSTALFDGQTLIPYIVALSATGAAGYVASLFHSIPNFSFVQRHFLAVGVVILISIAIAAGVVFLLALVGILWTLFSRRDDKLNKVDVLEDDDDSSLHHRPSSLLEHINAATRTTILGTSPYSNYNPEKEEEKNNRGGPDQEVYGADASNYLRAETPSDAMGGMAPEEISRPAHARYSFDGAGEGELPISAGTELEVLDDRDPSWWYARDVQTSREGVVPAAYLY